MSNLVNEDYMSLEEELNGDPLFLLKESIKITGVNSCKMYYTSIFHNKVLQNISYDVNLDLGAISFEFESPKGVGKTMTSPMQLLKEENRICAHHVTFNIFTSGHKETRLDEIFELSNTGKLGCLTPDYHFDDGNLNVVEFATTLSTDKRAFINVCHTKLAKYYEAIMSFSASAGRTATLNVIVVGREAVLSTTKLPNGLISELIFRYRSSLKFVAICRTHKLLQATDEELRDSASMESLKKMFESMDFNFDDEGEWTEANYLNWISAVSDQDKSNVFTNMGKMMKDSSNIVDHELQSRSRPQIELDSEAKFKIRLHLDEMRAHGNIRTDHKPVCIFPLVLPKSRSHYASYDFSKLEIRLPCDTALYTLWNSVLVQASENQEYLFEETVTDLFSTTVSLESVDVRSRSTYKRVAVNLTQDEWLKLAGRGICAKMFKDDLGIKELMAHSKQGFDPEVNTSDIEEFINSQELFTNACSYPGYLYDFADLVDKANLMAENSGSRYLESTSNLLKSFYKTKYFQYCSLITEISAELMMSLRQNCKRDQFVLKTLKYHDMILLIKPTTSDGHIFFSLLTLEDTSEAVHALPFTTFNREGNVLVSDFVSANAQQLSHWATCGAMSIVFFTSWLKYYSVDITEPVSMGDLPLDFGKMMNLSLLLFLEQKSSTEEVVTLFRYLSMECFKDNPGFCNTLKILDKMPTMFRSRLSSWVHAKLLIEAKRLYGKGYKYVTQGKKAERTKTRWTNLKNPYTQENISDPGLLVNLFYIGYIRNKNVRSSANQDMALISKILKGEMEYWKAKDKDTLGSCKYDYDSRPNSHNYDVGFMKILSNELKRGLESRLGLADSDSLGQFFLKNLSGLSIDSFMTLKASSSFKPGDEGLLMGHVEHKIKEVNRLSKIIDKTENSEVLEELQSLKKMEEEELSKMYVPRARPRVVEEFSEILVKYQPPALYLKESIEICNKHGLMIDIFKKPQQGGIREIYVVNRETRMVQFCIENLSRIICNEFESETMTHPKNKINLMTNHGALVRSRTEHLKQEQLASRMPKTSYCVVNSNSSKDKKSWNNTNSPSKFAIILLRLTPVWLHPFIFNSLKLWDKKNLLLPEGIRNVITKGKLWKISDKTMDEFVSAYFTHNKLYDKIIHEKKPFITIKTGMMQGILHFTSSVTHTAFNLLVARYFKTIASTQDWIQSSLFTHLESSDDSAYLKTLIIKSSEREKALKFLYTYDHFTCLFCKLAGFHESFPKTTLHSSRAVEFNSEFCFDNQVNKPDMKFSFATLRIPENESLSESCYQYKCLSSACLESGMNILGVHMIQQAQALIHYVTLGLTLNPYFKPYSRCLTVSTDPGLGFFPLDPCMLAGVVDHQFNVWMLMKGNINLAAKTARLLETEKLSSYSSGTVLKSAVIQFGDRKRWRAIVQRIEDRIGGVDYRKFVSDNPKLLFLRPETPDEIAAYHYLKMFTPSIISSLGNVGRMDKMLVRGGYMIQFKCITVGSLWEELLPSQDKTSMTKLLLDTLQMSRSKIQTVIDLNLGTEEETKALHSIDNVLSKVNSVEFDLREELRILTDYPVRDHINDRILNMHQQKCLFPQHSEYLSILSCHRSLKHSRCTPWVSHEKKRALVNVYTAPLKNLLSLESICLMKWFQHNVHRLPRSLVDSQWDKLKSTYHWLDETFKDSFERSQFENEISFANFIKEQSGKNRNLYVTSAPLKMEDGHSALFSLITRHSWPGILLKATSNDELMNRLSKDVLHPIALLAGLQLNSQGKVEQLKELVKSDYNYSSCLSEFLLTPAVTMREMRLKPILYALTGSSRKMISESLLQAKMGVMGSWIQPEKYKSDTRSYHGEGIWQGRIDDMNLKIFTTNSRITRIEVNDGFLLRTKFNALKEWMREVHLQFSEDRYVNTKNLGQLCASIKYNTLYDIPDSTGCTPVYENRNVKFNADDRNYKDFQVEITRYSVRLRAKMQRSTGKDRFGQYQDVTVLSCRLYDSDILQDPMYLQTSSRIMSLLFNNCPVGSKKVKPISKEFKTSTKRVSFIQKTPMDGMSIKTFLDEMRSSGPSRYKPTILTNNYTVANVEEDEGLSISLMRMLLPARFSHVGSQTKKPALVRRLQDIIKSEKSKLNFKVPEELIKVYGTWDDILLRIDQLSKVDLLSIISTISRKIVLLVEDNRDGFKLFTGGERINENSLPVSCMDILFMEFDRGKTKTTYFVQEVPRLSSITKRPVQLLTEIDSKDYEWSSMFEDLSLLKQICESGSELGFEDEFRQQLKLWLCKSFYKSGKFSMTDMEVIMKEPIETEQEEVLMEVDNYQQSEMFSETLDMDDFASFLQGDGCDIINLLTGETELDQDAEDDAASVASSVEEIVFREDEISEMHKLCSVLEKKGDVKCSTIRLFDSLVQKCLIEYDGLFTRPGSLEVRSDLHEGIFKCLNYFSGHVFSKPELKTNFDIPEDF